jgi:hypothetical protein
LRAKEEEMVYGDKERPVDDRPICDTPGCGREIPVGGEGHPEICPTCLAAIRLHHPPPPPETYYTETIDEKIEWVLHHHDRKGWMWSRIADLMTELRRLRSAAAPAVREEEKGELARLRPIVFAAKAWAVSRRLDVNPMPSDMARRRHETAEALVAALVNAGEL